MEQNETQGLDKLLDSPSYRFFKEIKDELPKLKCENSDCFEKNISTTTMYYITNENGIVNFKVNDSVCCIDFKETLQNQVNLIYQKHK
jgi:hypothetical protein